jgi:transcriptional regulator NrdR family protein
MCPRCGTKYTRVLETRTYQKVFLKRRRQCNNNCAPFWTYEISERLMKTIEKYATPSAQATAKRSSLWQLHQRIVRMRREGMPVKDIAAAVGRAPNTVSWVIKRYAPELGRGYRNAGL